MDTENSIIANQHIARRRALPARGKNPGKSPSIELFKERRGLFSGGSPFKAARREADPPLLPLLRQETRKRRDKPRGSSSSEGLGKGLGRLGSSVGAFLRSLEDRLIPPAFRDRVALRGLFRAAAILVLAGLGYGLYAFASTRPYPLPAGGLGLPADPSLDDALLAYLSPEVDETPVDSEAIASLPLPKTLVVGSYTVRKGDTLASVAKRFGLAVDTIVSMNGIKSARSLSQGRELKIPNMDGLVHVVSRGESLGGLAHRYKVDMTLLADSNDLKSEVISPGQSIFIPGARLPAATLRQLYGTTVIWPVRGPLSSYFGYRSDPFTGVRSFHTCLDIVVNMGTPVKAAMDGRVADVGYNVNYGNYVILNHSGGLQTLYGHLSSYSVRAGQSVSQGQVIALSGSTGYSTGPHLHFGVYRNGVMSNPLKLLK